MYRRSQWDALKEPYYTKPLLAGRLAKKYVAAKEMEQALKKILNAKQEALEAAKQQYTRLLKALESLVEALADA